MYKFHEHICDKLSLCHALVCCERVADRRLSLASFSLFAYRFQAMLSCLIISVLSTIDDYSGYSNQILYYLVGHVFISSVCMRSLRLKCAYLSNLLLNLSFLQIYDDFVLPNKQCAAHDR